jgi:hypothetical protein
MENDIRQYRILAVQRFNTGESPEAICPVSSRRVNCCDA